jgi:LPXTG-site transpeptidase (sortase) family protein
VGGRLFTDKGWHFLTFAGLAAAAASSGAIRPSWRAVAFWFALGIGVEIAQKLLPFGRGASLVDAGASLAGAIFGMLLAQVRVERTLRTTIAAGLVIVAASVAADLSYRFARTLLYDVLLAQALTGAEASPWPGAPADAFGALHFGDARIAIVDRATPQALALAPGLWPGRRPGDAGVTIVMGHRNAAFQALGAVRVGDVVDLETRDRARFRYVATRREIVRFDDSRLHPDAAGEQLALVTCWPVEASAPTPWRLVVYATRVREDVV